MRTRLLLTVGIVFLNHVVSAQWQQVANFDVGATGKIVSHGNAVFLYGFQGSYKLYRSTDNGTTWSDISSSAVAQFSDIFSFNGTLYACYLGTVYTSTTLGQSWTTLATVTVTGNGALIGFAADGATLFAFSNRQSIFRSSNNGASWTELLVSSPSNTVVVDFAARGTRYAAIVTGTAQGAYISDNAGATWTLRNPPTVASGIYASNTILYGMTFGGGMFTMQDGSSTWTSANSGMPSNGSLVIPKSATSQGNAVYVAYQQLVSNAAGIVRSTNDGVTWVHLDTTGFPTTTAAGGGSSRSVCATPTHVFYYSTPIRVGVYRTAGLPSAVREVASGIPVGFSLEQNYPNPFNPSTRIRFSVPSAATRHPDQSGQVAPSLLKVYDVLGREVATLVNENLPPGSYEVTFNADGLASGVYSYRFRTGEFTQTKRMMLLR